jgi:hypothetical protein
MGAMRPNADPACCAAPEAIPGTEDVGAFTRTIRHLLRINRMAPGFGLTVVPGAFADDTPGVTGVGLPPTSSSDVEGHLGAPYPLELAMGRRKISLKTAVDASL